MEESIRHDKAGNITNLSRGDWSDPSISYTYNNGNQLLSVSGQITGNFAYDLNRNVLTDGTRSSTVNGVTTPTTIAYNCLNLPVSASGAYGVASYSSVMRIIISKCI